jgi:glycerol-3-phosphate dehydrogenase
MPRRDEMWAQLGGEIDLLVVGGGITGAGIARDAARRGLKTALVEMNDLAFGTSSRSSKLIHGGVRYLEHYEFSLVFEAVSERRILMDLAPHLVNPLGFVFPVYETSRRSLWIVNAGLWLYDGLSLFRSPKPHKKLNPNEVRELEPLLLQEGLKGAPLYYDCSTDDARLTLETALDAAEAGATIATWCKAESFLKDEETGRLRGAVIKDTATGELKEVHAGAVINATGPWSDRTIAMSSPSSQKLLRPTKGVHIVVDAARLGVTNAVVCIHPGDQRVLFALPWGDRTYIGTTDTDYDGDPADVAADSSDVDYLIEASNYFFPESKIGRDDVIATWAGLRPLVAPPTEDGEVAESKVSREHQVIVGQDGLITIAGGKLTTYRRMAAEVVDTAVRFLHLSGKVDKKSLKDAATDDNPLPGGQGWPDDDDAEAVAAKVAEASGGTLDEEAALHLTHTYGMRAMDLAARCKEEPVLAGPIVEGRPERMVQVDWAVEQEFAATLNDVMVRRTQLYYRDFDQGLGVAKSVADVMGRRLGWDDEERASQVERYQAEVALSRAWKSE